MVHYPNDYNSVEVTRILKKEMIINRKLYVTMYNKLKL